MVRVQANGHEIRIFNELPHHSWSPDLTLNFFLHLKLECMLVLRTGADKASAGPSLLETSVYFAKNKDWQVFLKCLLQDTDVKYSLLTSSDVYRKNALLCLWLSMIYL